MKKRTTNLFQIPYQAFDLFHQEPTDTTCLAFSKTAHK